MPLLSLTLKNLLPQAYITNYNAGIYLSNLSKTKLKFTIGCQF